MVEHSGWRERSVTADHGLGVGRNRAAIFSGGDSSDLGLVLARLRLELPPEGDFPKADARQRLYWVGSGLMMGL